MSGSVRPATSSSRRELFSDDSETCANAALCGYYGWSRAKASMQDAPMPAVTEAALLTLRMKYNVAHSAYQHCLRAVKEASSSGAIPTPEMLEKEAAALQALTDARADLLRLCRTS
jgi:hypothetical protein